MVEGGAKEAGIRIVELCAHVGMSRQNYYAARRLRRRREVDEELIVVSHTPQSFCKDMMRCVGSSQSQNGQSTMRDIGDWE